MPIPQMILFHSIKERMPDDDRTLSIIAGMKPETEAAEGYVRNDVFFYKDGEKIHDVTYWSYCPMTPVQALEVAK